MWVSTIGYASKTTSRGEQPPTHGLRRKMGHAHNLSLHANEGGMRVYAPPSVMFALPLPPMYLTPSIICFTAPRASYGVTHNTGLRGAAVAATPRRLLGAAAGRRRAAHLAALAGTTFRLGGLCALHPSLLAEVQPDDIASVHEPVVRLQRVQILRREVES